MHPHVVHQFRKTWDENILNMRFVALNDNTNKEPFTNPPPPFLYEITCHNNNCFSPLFISFLYLLSIFHHFLYRFSNIIVPLSIHILVLVLNFFVGHWGLCENRSCVMCPPSNTLNFQTFDRDNPSSPRLCSCIFLILITIFPSSSR